MRYYDITPEISSELAVFPGDTPFSQRFLYNWESGHHLQLSKIETTLHLGAHADSSSHYNSAGTGVEKRALSHFIGNVQVVDVPLKKNHRVMPADFAEVKIRAPRVLFKTNSFLEPTKWNNDFMALSPEVIYELHEQGVLLVGIDTPSVDPMDSKVLESHQALFKTQMSVLEGLVLQSVPVGIYTLVALPLPIKGGDASPVRAILIDKEGLLENLQKA